MFAQYTKELERNTFLRFVIPIKKKENTVYKKSVRLFFYEWQKYRSSRF